MHPYLVDALDENDIECCDEVDAIYNKLKQTYKKLVIKISRGSIEIGLLKKILNPDDKEKCYTILSMFQVTIILLCYVKKKRKNIS